MAGTSRLKADRVQLRVDARTKRTLERAAAYARTSVTDFVVAHAAEAAQRVIDQHEKATLSPQDWDVFFEALTNPPKPNEKLKAAYREHRKRIAR